MLQVALLLIYNDRVRYLKERKAERAAKKAAATGQTDEAPAVTEGEPQPA